MIKLIYTVAKDKREEELEWLAEQKVFPSIQPAWDWKKEEEVLHFGMIVSPEAALSIKLRHNLTMQTTYKQR